MYGDASMSAGMGGSDIYMLSIFCRYTNRDTRKE